MSPARARPLLVAMGSVAEPRGGNQTRSRLTAEILAELGMVADIVTTKEPPGRPKPPWAASLQAPRKDRYLSLELVRLIHEAGQGASFVVVTNAMLLPALLLARVRAPLVWDTNECQTLHYRRLPTTPANCMKLAAWFLLERWSAHRCSIAIAISATEARTWLRSHPPLRKKLAVVDHAVPAQWRDPAQSRRDLCKRFGLDPAGSILLFLGTLEAKQNTRAVRWIISNLMDALPPAATVVLCGPGTETVVAVTGRSGARLVALGEVDDVDSVVAASDLCLAPMAAGAGVKTKVLHYLAHGRPVAGTPVAFEGLEDAPGLYAASLEDLAPLVSDLCANNKIDRSRCEKSHGQQAWVEQYHGRTLVSGQWRKVLDCLP
jgi:hypothetical protein